MKFADLRGLVEVLTQVRKKYPDAIIAGGVLRDLVLGKRPKDIDVFTFEDISNETLMNPFEEADYDPSGGRIASVTKPFEFKDLLTPVQIVQLNQGTFIEVHEAVSQFCFGINQIWLDMMLDSYGIKWTRAFAQDMIMQEFTVTYCCSKHEARRLVEKAKSLQDRYPGWDLVVPEKYDHQFNPPSDFV
jgi:hypothetical protein